MIKNPFLKYGYQGPEYFCDRETEIQTISRTMSGGASNITLISPRRMGKTGLIKRTFEQMLNDTPQAVFVYVDALPTRSFEEFVQIFGENVLTTLQNRHSSIFKRTLDLLKSLRPVFSTDAITGNPTVSLTIQPDNAEMTLSQIFDLLEQSGRPCYVALDEFQQVSTFTPNNVEAILRSHIQFLKNVRFIFAGSSMHMMTQIFMSAKLPFFNSTQVVTLKPIDEDIYYAWANRFFEMRGGHLSREIFHTMYSTLDGHTWYVQAVLNTLYDNHVKVNNEACYQQAIASIVEENKDYYQNLIALLTNNQLKLLRAIACEGKASAINASRFIHRYNLKTSSSVNTALKSLLDKELVYKQAKTYEVADRFLALYLRTLP